MEFLTSRPRQPMFRVPSVVLWLIAALVLAHIARVLLPADASEDLMIRFAFLPMRYLPNVNGGSLVDLAAPFLGYQFLHAGFLHLGMNCIWLLACGPVVARRFGSWLFLAFFFLCGIAGAAVFLACDWGGIDGMIGASGAVSGLMAATIRMIPWHGMPIWMSGAKMPLAPLTSRPVLTFTAIWFVTNAVFGWTGLGSGGEIHQIAWQAHIGGYLAGLLLSSLFDMARQRAAIL